jgi:hypothetical protein
MTAIQTGTAYTILEQLGGRKFVVMTGAKALTLTPESLRFRLPGRFAKDGINVVSIVLTHRDDYDLTFGTVTPRGMTIKTTREGVYAENLTDVFTSVTGLQTSLGTMGGK